MPEIEKSMLITKKPVTSEVFFRPAFSFPNARSAFKALLQELLLPGDAVLLPSYIGWSRNEGSGVFDPIQETGAEFSFYRMTRDLTIDLQDLSFKLTQKKPKLLVLIHYFGYPDPNLVKIVKLAHDAGVYVLEDEAHALFSDWVGGVCGRLGDAVIFSLHKMLPFECGGLLVLNRSLKSLNDRLTYFKSNDLPEFDWWNYDFVGIATRRRQNALHLLDLLRPFSDRVTPLHSEIPLGVIPQTLPVLINHTSRDAVYFALNDLGYGVVSLYHTLISQIDAAEFPDSCWLSHRILNLPIHQDISLDLLQSMIIELEGLV